MYTSFIFFLHCNTDTFLIYNKIIKISIFKKYFNFKTFYRCKISFNKSLAAVRCVLQSLGHELPAFSEVTKSIERQIQDEKLVKNFILIFSAINALINAPL